MNGVEITEVPGVWPGEQQQHINGAVIGVQEF